MNFSSVDVIWTLLGAALVYFMQAGFAMCEAGLTRAKNTGNILMKNMMDFCIGTPAFWLVGFGLMFGGTFSPHPRSKSTLLGDANIFLMRSKRCDGVVGAAGSLA